MSVVNLARLPSASALDRAFSCVGSCVLPAVYEPSSEAAERGIALHTFVETARRDGREAALAMMSGDEDTFRDAKALDLSAIPDGAESEVAFGFDHETDTAIRYELTGGRRYPLDGRLHGTADYVGKVGQEVVVIDLKTGRPAVSAADSWQLRFLALAAARWSGLPRVRASLFVLDAEGGWRQDWTTWDEFDLAGFADELGSLVRRVRATTEPTLVVGSHCKHCPALLRCPAQTAIVRALVPTLTEITDRLEALTPEEQGRAYTNMKVAEELMDRAKDAFRNLAARGDIPLPDGRTLKTVTMNRSSCAKGAAEYVAKTAGVDVLAGACTLKLSALPELVVASLEGAGLVNTVPVVQVRPVGKKKAA